MPPSPPERLVLVRLHAQAASLASTEETRVELAAGATAADVKSALAGRHPELAKLLSSCVVATDEEYLRDAAPIGEAAALHLVPPVSGG